MRTSHSFWASMALLLAPAALAESTKTSDASTTSAAPSCTASLITKLCDYKQPGPEFAVAASKDSCLEYCNDHQPCAFAIFVTGNPYTGSGTCWLYPGENFDASAGNTDCGNPYLSVYDKPTCTGKPTDTSGCAAIATPSAIASVCEYPAPDDCAVAGCKASLGASDCLKSCVEADACNYVVFNPHNPSNTPYASGTCWLYSEGKYNAEAAISCKDHPEQFVYTNPCPKPRPSPSSSTLSLPASTPSGTSTTGQVENANAALDASSTKDSWAPTTGLSLTTILAVGFTMLLWQNFV